MNGQPDRPDELERIEGCGGKVIDWNGQRVLGVLATSRSIGIYMISTYCYIIVVYNSSTIDDQKGNHVIW